MLDWLKRLFRQRPGVGEVVVLKNTNAHAAADESYYLVYVRYQGKLVPLAMTDHEFRTGAERSAKQQDDIEAQTGYDLSAADIDIPKY